MIIPSFYHFIISKIIIISTNITNWKLTDLLQPLVLARLATAYRVSFISS